MFEKLTVVPISELLAVEGKNLLMFITNIPPQYELTWHQSLLVDLLVLDFSRNLKSVIFSIYLFSSLMCTEFLLVSTGTNEYILTKDDVGRRLGFSFIPVNFEGQRIKFKCANTESFLI
jgi:hypothetical protein